jgi:hypothetical protein
MFHQRAYLSKAVHHADARPWSLEIDLFVLVRVGVSDLVAAGDGLHHLTHHHLSHLSSCIYVFIMWLRGR